MAKQTNEKLFIGGIIKVLKEQPFDIQLKAKDTYNKDHISAHKLILSARSEVFKKMFESKHWKASCSLETVTFSDMKHKKLEAFVEFIYSDGSMLSEKQKTHVMSLYRAAGKYEIPHLRDLCRNRLLLNFNSYNVLDILELAQYPLDYAFKMAALDFIKRNITNIASSEKFYHFVAKNPNLTVEIVNTSFNKSSNDEYEYCIHCNRF